MRTRLFIGLQAFGLFLVILGLKFDVIHRFGSALPMWDQWDAEGLHVFVPQAAHKLGPGDFFRAHNEHRIALARLLGFAELATNGQWDARLQCVVNAFLHAAFGVFLYLFGRRSLSPRWHTAWFAFVAALIGPPLAWQNAISGFHSQQYFLLPLSFGMIVLLPDASPWSVRWWLGAACGALALFSMASGLLAAAVVIAVMLLAGWRRGRLIASGRNLWIGTALASAVLLGLALVAARPATRAAGA